jgi:hypothetical protein
MPLPPSWRKPKRGAEEGFVQKTFSRSMMKNLPIQTRKTNKTGITGVAVTDGFCHSYIVNATGKRISRKFSITKYGKSEALRLAIKWRRDNELDIHGYSVIPEKFIQKTSQHEQSARDAANIKQQKKLSATERRENEKRALAQRKRVYKRMAGKYIYRIDDLDLGHGWLLRIETQKETLCSVLFRDSRYGSADDALQQAKNERENQLMHHNIPYANGRRFSKKLRSTNRTGVTGICRSNSYYHCYIPLKPNKRKVRKISIDKYGEKLAFRMAVEWRQKMELDVYGGTVLSNQQTDELVFRKTSRKL